MALIPSLPSNLSSPVTPGFRPHVCSLASSFLGCGLRSLTGHLTSCLGAGVWSPPWKSSHCLGAGLCSPPGLPPSSLDARASSLTSVCLSSPVGADLCPLIRSLIIPGVWAQVSDSSLEDSSFLGIGIWFLLTLQDSGIRCLDQTKIAFVMRHSSI